MKEDIHIPKSPSLTSGEGSSIFERNMLFGLISKTVIHYQHCEKQEPLPV